MSRAAFIESKDRDRLLKNTLITSKNAVRDHAILRCIFGAPIRLIELARIETHEVANREGKVLDLENFVITKETSFNGTERLFPLIDKKILDALQSWLDWRIANGWGVTSTGFLDLETKLFLYTNQTDFKVYTKLDNGKPKSSCETLNRLVRDLFRLNGIKGNINSPLRTWTILKRRSGASIDALWVLRGDNSIESVRETVKNDPIRLSLLVEKAFL